MLLLPFLPPVGFLSYIPPLGFSVRCLAVSVSVQTLLFHEAPLLVTTYLIFAGALHGTWGSGPSDGCPLSTERGPEGLRKQDGAALKESCCLCAEDRLQFRLAAISVSLDRAGIL